MYKTNLLRLFTLVCSGLVFAACQTAPEPDPLPRELRYSSVVSTSARSFAPQPGARVRWRGDIIVHAPEGTPSDPDSRQYIREQIQAQLQAKGYQLVAEGQYADYALQGLIVLGNELNEQALRDVLGFEPGLVASGTPYQKGSLLLILLDPSTQETQWRSAVEILAAPDLPEATRQERLRYGVSSLMRPLPAATRAQ